MRDDHVNLAALDRIAAHPMDHVRLLVGRAIILDGGVHSGQFTSRGFARSVATYFGTREMGEEWVEDVLRKVEYVVRMPGPRGFYRRQG